jgi:hypothetical protein
MSYKAYITAKDEKDYYKVEISIESGKPVLDKIDECCFWLQQYYLDNKLISDMSNIQEMFFLDK